MKLNKLITVLAIALMVTSCQRVPITGRKQLNLLPESQMIGMSTAAYGEFLTANKTVPANDQNTQMVKKVGNRIAVAVEEYLKANKQSNRIEGFEWEFNLVQDDQVNAWAMPGGKVVVYTGLLEVTKDETGLAVVLGHEIAHAIARHGNERMSQQIGLQLGGVALSVALQEKPQETQNLFYQAYGLGTTFGVMLPFSRNHESEADKMGLIFMAMAGYNPEEAPKFWERMSASGGAQPPEFMSTHPSNETRVRDLNDFMKEALKYYRPQP